MPAIYSPSLVNIATIQLALEGITWLTKSDMMPEGFLPNLQQAHSISYTLSGHVVGVLLFTLQHNTAVVELAYVEPSCRRMGYFREMLDTLTIRCKKLGVENIDFIVGAENEAAADVLEQVGGAVTRYVYRVGANA